MGAMGVIGTIGVMGAKEYLRQVERLDAIIKGKLEAIEALRSTVLNCTAVLSDMPSGGHNPQSKSNAIAALVDLEAEINADIDKFVNTKREVMRVVESLSNPLHIEVLNRRYMSYQKWEQIAYECNVDYRWVHRLHCQALDLVDVILQTRH